MFLSFTNDCISQPFLANPGIDNSQLTNARELSIRTQPNELVTVESQRGRLEAQAVITHSVRAGQVFLPMHYEQVNLLTDPVFDPYSK